MRDESRAPLFRFDPGWPFVIAGLLILAAGILIPGHRELLELRGELVRQETREQVAFEQLRAYDEFLAGVRETDPEVIRRLAMAHLNKIPAGEESLLLTPGMNQTVGEWIESSIPDRTVVVPPYPDTVLARWALGPGRLWMLGVAVMLLFVGFVLGPSTPSIPALSAVAAWRRAPRAAASAGTEAVAGFAVGSQLDATAEAAEATAADVEAVTATEAIEAEAEVDSFAASGEETGVESEDEEEASEPDAGESEEPADEGTDIAADLEIDSGIEAGASETGDPDEVVAEPCDSRGFDLVEAKSMSFDSPDRGPAIEELRATELELWKASETHGNWCAVAYLEQLPPEESVASCDDVTLAFLDQADGELEARGAD